MYMMNSKLCILYSLQVWNKVGKSDNRYLISIIFFPPISEKDEAVQLKSAQTSKALGKRT